MEDYWLLMLIAYGFVSYIIAIHFKGVARMKGHEEERYFWMPFIFGIPGWILVAALPDKKMLESITNSVYSNSQAQTRLKNTNTSYNDLPEI